MQCIDIWGQMSQLHSDSLCWDTGRTDICISADFERHFHVYLVTVGIGEVYPTCYLKW